MTSKLDPPVETALDKAHEIAKALISDVVPVGGGTTSTIIGMLIQSPLAARRAEWEREVSATIMRLQSQRGVDPAALLSNPEFVDTLSQATLIAMRHTNGEKRRALRAALFNSGTASSPDETRRAMFLKNIDTLTEWHLKSLAVFESTEDWFLKNQKLLPIKNGERFSVLVAAFAGSGVEDYMFEQIWYDLQAEGLLPRSHNPAFHSSNTLRQSCVTELGRQFLAFIREDTIATMAEAMA